MLPFCQQEQQSLLHFSWFCQFFYDNNFLNGHSFCWDLRDWRCSFSWNFPVILEQPLSAMEDQTWANGSEHPYLPWQYLACRRSWPSQGPSGLPGSHGVENQKDPVLGEINHRTQENPHKWKGPQMSRGDPSRKRK